MGEDSMEQSDPRTRVPRDTDRKKNDAAPLGNDPALLRRTEVRQGRFPGQERIRIVRPSRTSLQRVDTGLLKATEETMAPGSGVARAIYRTKRFLIGSPLANEQAVHERLTKFKALAVLSSDAISSVAYATEACMGVLLFAG